MRSELGSTRTTRSSLRFSNSFCLGDDQEVFPAGHYDVLTTEAVHQGNVHTVYQRVSTVLIVVEGGTTRYCEVSPADLDAALLQQGADSAAHPANP